MSFSEDLVYFSGVLGFGAPLQRSGLMGIRGVWMTWKDDLKRGHAWVGSTSRRPRRPVRRLSAEESELCEQGEEILEYVDRISPRIVFLVFFIVLSSQLDALFALIHLRNGATEANLVMLLAMEKGVFTFLVVKASMTALGALILAAIRNLRLAFVGLHAIAFASAALLAYHAYLFAAHGF